MKKSLLLLLFLPAILFGQIRIDTTASIDNFLDHFRSDQALLTEFFKRMPKGGDLHHHYSGSVPTEIYVDYALNHFWINLPSLEVRPEPPRNTMPGERWMDYRLLVREGILDQVRDDLIRDWSVREFDGDDPSDQFFDSFGKFSLAKNETYGQGLRSLKQIAKAENVQYLETMLTSVDCDAGFRNYGEKNDQMLRLAEARDEEGLEALLRTIFEEYQEQAAPCVADHNGFITRIHEELALDDEDFTIRYQNYEVRVIPPLDVYKGLILSFLSAEASSLVVGVNFVAPEHYYIAIRDYWLHMRMFAFLHQQFPDVRIALHAGELTPNLANPVELNYHITDALFIAGASRIGHGVTIPYEVKNEEVLDHMRNRRKAVEINLSSNEFILDVEGNEHPISLYYYHGVPIVLSTDDAGVLRTTLTDQYVLLCQRYPYFSYQDIKAVAFNSIELSFIEKSGVKGEVRERLRKAFVEFEEQWIEEMEEVSKWRSLLTYK